ncbi:MAG: response regulator, partial [Magnetococcales bacterium]|nr:response regulator [Magnetococcales bacterium]
MCWRRSSATIRCREAPAVSKGILRGRYRVRVAKSGELALRQVEKTPLPDLILLDIMMPGLDGYQVCERLKANEKTRSIPVIFVTAMTQVEDEIKGFNLGAVDYITKPFSPPVVL